MYGSLPIVHERDVQHGRKNAKIELKSGVSQDLNHLKHLNETANSFLKLD